MDYKFLRYDDVIMSTRETLEEALPTAHTFSFDRLAPDDKHSRAQFAHDITEALEFAGAWPAPEWLGKKKSTTFVNARAIHANTMPTAYIDCNCGARTCHLPSKLEHKTVTREEYDWENAHSHACRNVEQTGRNLERVRAHTLVRCIALNYPIRWTQKRLGFKHERWFRQFQRDIGFDISKYRRDVKQAIVREADRLEYSNKRLGEICGVTAETIRNWRKL